MNDSGNPNPFAEDGGLLPVAAFVRRYAPAIVTYCETKMPNESARLLDASYAKVTFALSGVAFFRETTTLEGNEADGRYGKSDADRHFLGMTHVRLTSQWSRNRPKQYIAVVQYLAERDILDAATTVRLLDLIGAMKPAQKKLDSKAKAYHIGDAQNLAIRTVLDRIDAGPLQSEWTQTLAEFDQACAYCLVPFDTFIKPVFEHVVGVNQTALGENTIGNLVPACSPCNDEKSSKDFRDWIRSSSRISNPEAAIARIEAHMTQYQYLPLSNLFPHGDARLTAALAELRSDLDAAAYRCAGIIQSLKDSGEDRSKDR